MQPYLDPLPLRPTRRGGNGGGRGEAGAQTRLLTADLSSSAGIEEFCGQIAGERIDVLINNAGSLVKRARLAEYTPELFDAVMNLNAKSAYFVAQSVAPGMADRGHGVVVNLSSIAARNGGGLGATIYAAAKAAVACMTKGLRANLRQPGSG